MMFLVPALDALDLADDGESPPPAGLSVDTLTVSDVDDMTVTEVDDLEVQ